MSAVVTKGKDMPFQYTYMTFIAMCFKEELRALSYCTFSLLIFLPKVVFFLALILNIAPSCFNSLTVN